MLGEKDASAVIENWDTMICCFPIGQKKVRRRFRGGRPRQEQNRNAICSKSLMITNLETMFELMMQSGGAQLARGRSLRDDGGGECLASPDRPRRLVQHVNAPTGVALGKPCLSETGTNLVFGCRWPFRQHTGSPWLNIQVVYGQQKNAPALKESLCITSTWEIATYHTITRMQISNRFPSQPHY